MEKIDIIQLTDYFNEMLKLKAVLLLIEYTVARMLDNILMFFSSILQLGLYLSVVYILSKLLTITSFQLVIPYRVS